MILLQFILVHYAFFLIAGKYNGRERLMTFAKKRKIKFFYSVAECLFCYTHHIGALLLPFLILGNGFDFVFLLYPLMSTGAIFLIKKW